MIIAIEGIDGAGKRTQAEALSRALKDAGKSSALLSFPRYGETFFARSIARYLNGGFGDIHGSSPYLPALLFAGDRFQSRDLIVQLARHNDALIIDRYVASNMAYNAAKLAVPERPAMVDWIRNLEYGAYNLPGPDLTIYLDVLPGIAFDMVGQKGEREYTAETRDIYERNVDYLAECRAVYGHLAEEQVGGRWISIECMGPGGRLRPPEEIHAEIWSSLGKHAEKLVE